MATARRKEGERAPGRPPKHGARALARLLHANRLDGRTGPARDRAALLSAIGEDAGGFENLTARQRLTAEIAVDAILICRAIMHYALRGGLFVTGPDGVRLVPTVAKGLATYQGVATRALVALGMRPDQYLSGQPGAAAYGVLVAPVPIEPGRWEALARDHEEQLGHAPGVPTER